MSDFYVYLHCLPDGTPFYVGKGTKKRAYKMSNRTDWHKRIVTKYGVKVILFPMSSEQEAFSNEIIWIAALRSAEFKLCNITDGGEGASGNKKTAEVAEKTAKAHRGMKRSEETKRRISEAKRGVSRPPVTEATRAKLSEAAKKQKRKTGYKFSEEGRRNCSLAQLGNKKAAGRKQSQLEIDTRVAANKLRADEIGLKISAALKGRPSPLRGRTIPDEVKVKMKISAKKRWESKCQ